MTLSRGETIERLVAGARSAVAGEEEEEAFRGCDGACRIGSASASGLTPKQEKVLRESIALLKQHPEGKLASEEVTRALVKLAK